MPKNADVLQQKSPAEFFAENKNIAGFDNVRSDTWSPWCPLTPKMKAIIEPTDSMFTLYEIHHWILQPGKCLYTTVRELVENSLDAAESGGELPQIEINM